jgi:hypothetical protein
MYEKDGDFIHIPITINAFLKEDRIFIQVSELSDHEIGACVMQFSSKLGELEQSAAQQACNLISTRYLDFSDMLLNVLSVLTDNVLNPNKNLITEGDIYCPTYHPFEFRIPSNLLEEKRLLDGSEILASKHIEKNVIAENYTPSSDMLATLKMLQQYFIADKVPSGFMAATMEIGLVSVMLVPKDILHPRYVDYMNDVIELTCHYSCNGTFKGEKYDIAQSGGEEYGMITPDYYVVNFESVVNNEVVKFTYRTVKENAPLGQLPVCFIKAVDKYCELNRLLPAEMPFIFGVLMLCAFHENGSVLDEEKQSNADWFLMGIDNYLKTYPS